MKFVIGEVTQPLIGGCLKDYDHTLDVVSTPGNSYRLSIGLANVTKRRTGLGFCVAEVTCHRTLSAEFSLNLREVSIKQGAHYLTASRFWPGHVQ